MTKRCFFGWLPFLCLLALAMGCQSYAQGRRSSGLYRPDKSMKPVVAVMDFENQAGFSGQWNLGGGMADVLVTQLLETDRVIVLERKNLGDVMSEIMRQGQDFFRSEGRVEKGRLKNAKYLIRGVVTDFTVTGDVSGWFGMPRARLFGRGSTSRVAVNIKVSDVETGEIVTSMKTEGSASGGGVGGAVNYKKVAFGGDAFFQTPLGKATDIAMRRAVKLILKNLPVQYWQPRVAEGGPDGVVINGGENVRVRVGDVFVVREDGRDIKDPVTGNVLERVAGRVVGRIEVNEVKPLSAHARILHGEARRGQILEAVK
jgi:curli biogenesis system outer membrane secretion channel CsgG